MFDELTLTAMPLPLGLRSSPLLDAVAELTVLDDAVATAFESSIRRSCAEIDRDMTRPARGGPTMKKARPTLCPELVGLAAEFDEIPGEGGWWKDYSRDRFVEAANELIAAGIAPDRVIRILSDLYAATADCFGN